MFASRYARRVVPVALVILLVVGWMLAFYLMATRSRLLNEIDAQNRAVGTLQTLQQQIGDFEAEAERLRASNQAVEEYLAARQAEFVELRAQIEAARDDLSTRRSDLEALEARLAPLREELQTFDTRLTEIQQRLAARSEELATIGERLTEARAQEAEVQGRLATLRETVARLATEAAGAEERVQVAREAEASLRTQLVSANNAMDQLRSEQERVREEVAGLSARRERLLTDNQEAAEQRDTLQGVVTELSEVLAARSNELAELERRIAQLQARANQAAAAVTGGAEDRRTQAADGQSIEGQAGNAAAQPGFNASLLPSGEYESGTAIARFAEDGTFQLEERNAGGAERRLIGGHYALDGETLTLLEADGDIGTMTFPMICELVPSAVEEGLVIMDADGQCALLAGETLRPRTGEAAHGDATAP